MITLKELSGFKHFMKKVRDHTTFIVKIKGLLIRKENINKRSDYFILSPLLFLSIYTVVISLLCNKSPRWCEQQLLFNILLVGNHRTLTPLYSSPPPFLFTVTLLPSAGSKNNRNKNNRSQNNSRRVNRSILYICPVSVVT